MGTLLFIFKLIFSPVKVIYQMMTGKKRKTHFLLKPLKLCLTVVFIIFSISVILADMNEQDIFVGDWRSNGTSIVPVEIDLSEIEDEELLEENPDGSVNGLNLQLIDSIKTDGYVKELLTLLRSSANGEINSYSNHLSLVGYIGIQTNESGSFFGTIAKAYIPVEGKTILWGKSKYGIPAESMKIKSLTGEQGMLIAQNESDIYYISPSGYYGLFQTSAINLSYKADKIGDSSRSGNTFYYPDAISYLDGRVSAGIATGYSSDLFDTYASENQDIINLIAAGFHNAGEHGFVSPLVYGTDYRKFPNNWWTSDGLNVSATIEIYEDLVNAFKKNESLRSKQFDSPSSRIVGTYLLCEAGWSIDTIGLNYILNKVSWGSNVGEKVLGDGKTNEDLKNYFKSKVKSLPISDYEAQSTYGWQSASASIQFYGYPKGAVYKYKDSKIALPSGKTANEMRWINMETLGQIYSSLFGGYYYYGSMLQYAGVNVDPTDPNSYMNTLPEGEWKPSGDSVWMSNYPEIDQSKLTSKREAFLNEAYKWLGSWYVYGGQYPPEKDANGNWIDGNPVGKTPTGNGSMKGFDCSLLIQYCVKQTLGIDVTRATPTQQSTSTMTTISASEAKPGDVVYYYKEGASVSHHVGIFLGRNSEGVDLILHAPETGDVVKIALRPYPEHRKLYRRINGIDD